MGKLIIRIFPDRNKINKNIEIVICNYFGKQPISWQNCEKFCSIPFQTNINFNFKVTTQQINNFTSQSKFETDHQPALS